MADFQVRTVFAHLQRHVPRMRGTILDVGCGQMPYKHLVDESHAQYVGIDVQDAARFDYDNPAAIRFDGVSISAADQSFDHVLCTEVLEHVAKPEPLVAEIHRVLKKGGTAIVTVPWSARFHYIPHDYHRFTPSALERLFEAFSSRTIEPRGTDITAIASKVIVAYLRTILGGASTPAWKRAFALGTSIPALGGAVGLGHLSLALNLGSSDDPLGYVAYLTK
jgi:ubiquinone/menaquinone biosynthesis C-methylase UbiE